MRRKFASSAGLVAAPSLTPSSLEYSNKRASSAHSSNRPSNPYSATLVIGAGIVGSKLTAASGFATDIACLLCSATLGLYLDGIYLVSQLSNAAYYRRIRDVV